MSGVRPRQIRYGGYLSSLQVNGKQEAKSGDGYAMSTRNTAKHKGHVAHDGLYSSGLRRVKSYI
jgi:hypothetical protein